MRALFCHSSYAKAEQPVGCADLTASRRARSSGPLQNPLWRRQRPWNWRRRLLFVFAADVRGGRARQLLRQAIEALPEPGRAEYADALARLEAEDELERRLREGLAEAERALTKAQQDLDEARSQGERVAAEPLREAHERLREVGIFAQCRAVDVAEKRREFEQLRWC